MRGRDEGEFAFVAGASRRKWRLSYNGVLEPLFCHGRLQNLDVFRKSSFAGPLRLSATA